jgi:hypothetical protein
MNNPNGLQITDPAKYAAAQARVPKERKLTIHERMRERQLRNRTYSSKEEKMLAQLDGWTNPHRYRPEAGSPITGGGNRIRFWS